MSGRYQKGIEEMRRHLGPKADEYVEALREFTAATQALLTAKEVFKEHKAL